MALMPCSLRGLGPAVALSGAEPQLGGAVRLPVGEPSAVVLMGLLRAWLQAARDARQCPAFQEAVKLVSR